VPSTSSANALTRYGFFGPAGTFTHEALQVMLERPSHVGTPVEPVTYATVGAALTAVRAGEVAAALVPIENSVEGGVSATLDTLTHGEPLVISDEVLLPVRFVLCARPGTEPSAIRRILTHPHAAAQCRDWLAAHFPLAVVTEGPSTAGSAAEVADPQSTWDAAVCARAAGAMYGLTPVAEDIADNPDAVTRFVLVSRPVKPPAATGADKTTLVLFQHDDHSGALLEILDQFASRGVNLCRIESRPTRTTLGSYCFSVDAEGHIDDARMGEAMIGLHRICQAVIYLGSYPRADHAQPRLLRGTSNDDYDEARTWLDLLRFPRP